MNKNQFSIKWKSLCDYYDVDSIIGQEDLQWLFSTLSMTKTYKKISPNTHYITLKYFKIKNFSRVKMFHAISLFQDGVEIPIAKTKVINQLYPPKKIKKSNHVNDVKSASRNVVQPQIKEFRKQVKLPIICPLSGIKLTNWKDIHIDHSYPFILMFNEWMDINELKFDDIQLKGYRNSKTFKLKNFEESWYDYHEKNSILQAVHKKANMSKGCKILPPTE